MTIKTETTVTFYYPEDMEAEVSFTHDNDMSEWTQSIKDGMVSYTRISETEMDSGRGEQE